MSLLVGPVLRWRQVLPRPRLPSPGTWRLFCQTPSPPTPGPEPESVTVPTPAPTPAPTRTESSAFQPSPSAAHRPHPRPRRKNPRLTGVAKTHKLFLTENSSVFRKEAAKSVYVPTRPRLPGKHVPWMADIKSAAFGLTPNDRVFWHKLEKIETTPTSGCRVVSFRGVFDPFLHLEEFWLEPMARHELPPHRGLESLTYLLEGELLHSDNHGNRGHLTPGAAHLVAAGRGTIPTIRAGPAGARGVRIVVNTPAKHKMADPMYWVGRPPVYPDIPAPRAQVAMISGAPNSITHAPTFISIVHPAPGQLLSLPVEATQEVILLGLAGTMHLSRSVPLKTGMAVKYPPNDEANRISLKAYTRITSSFLLISGAPVDEPLVLEGAIAVSSLPELRQTLADVHLGRNGFQEFDNFGNMG